MFQSSSYTCEQACMIADSSVAWLQGRLCEDIHCASRAGDSLIDSGRFGANMLNWHHQRTGFQSIACQQTGKRCDFISQNYYLLNLYQYRGLVGLSSWSMTCLYNTMIYIFGLRACPSVQPDLAATMGSF